MEPRVRVERRFQGPTGSGQGGWTAHRFAEHLVGPVTVSLHAAIPLETDLVVDVDEPSGIWRLTSSDGDDRTTIMTASPRAQHRLTAAQTSPVSIDEASAARTRFSPHEHPVPWCFSCGVQPDSMCVHPSVLADGRYATDWTAPAWATDDSGVVDGGAVWAALDCTAAWYVSRSGEERSALTVRFDAEILEPIRAGEPYAIVGWSGDAAAGWDGRKRHAASAAFARDGTCVATSTSLWVSIER